MWRTSSNDRTLTGAEAILFAQALLDLLDETYMSNDCDDDYLLGISPFDNLTYGQKIAVLTTVGDCLLREDDRAVEKALNSLNVYRGILNYSLNFGQFSYSFGGGQRKPINKIFQGPIHTLHKQNGAIAADNMFWYEEECRQTLPPYSNTNAVQFEKIQEFANELRRRLRNSKIRETVEDAILLYNAALDSYNYEISYIKLWAALELLCGKNIDEYQDKVVRRTAFIFHNHSEAIGILQLLKDFRNDLAHKGFMNAKMELFVYDLKFYVEYLIRFLVFNSPRFKNYDDVRLLLDSSKNTEELNRKIRLIDFAKEINKERKT